MVFTVSVTVQHVTLVFVYTVNYLFYFFWEENVLLA